MITPKTEPKEWEFRDLATHITSLKRGDTCSQKGVTIIDGGYMMVSSINVRIDQHLKGINRTQTIVLGMDETKLLKQALK